MDNKYAATVLDKLKFSEETYRKASKRIHNRYNTEQLKILADTKLAHFDTLAEHFGLNTADHSLKLQDRVRLEMSKAEIEIEHIYLQRNEREVLRVCLRRERELIEAYEALEKVADLDEQRRQLVHRQKDDAVRVSQELESTMDDYDFSQIG